MTIPRLSRRCLMSSWAGAFILVPQAQAAQPYTIRFISGGFDGTVFHGGLEVRMAAGWKTYWRVPGAGGIPPDIAAKGENLAAFRFAFPLPRRFHGEDGETIGYKDEVVFPFEIEAKDTAKPVVAGLSAFFGVCETICIPVQARDSITWKPIAASTGNDLTLLLWRQRVPRLVEDGPARQASIVEKAGKAYLHVVLKEMVRDIFVEGNALHYYSAPQWQEGGLAATLEIHGVKAPEAMRGKSLRLTIDRGGVGLEQSLVVV